MTPISEHDVDAAMTAGTEKITEMYLKVVKMVTETNVH